MKAVIVIQTDLPAGLAANTCAVLAMSFGNQHPQLIGTDLTDQLGNSHSGITTIPLPILQADPELLTEIAGSCHRDDSIQLVGFTTTAQTSKDYSEYTSRMSAASEEISYLGILLYGPRKLINRITGSLPLYR